MSKTTESEKATRKLGAEVIAGIQRYKLNKDRANAGGTPWDKDTDLNAIATAWRKRAGAAGTESCAGRFWFKLTNGDCIVVDDHHYWEPVYERKNKAA